MQIGDKICELRKKAHLTQRDLGEKINVSDKVISRWENNESLPDIGEVKMISIIFSVSIDKLLDNFDSSNDINSKEHMDERKIWQLKRSVVISLTLMIASVIFLVLAKEYGKIDGIGSDLKNSIFLALFLASILTFVICLSLFIVSFLRLLSFSKQKYYRAEYSTVLKRILLVFCCFLLAYIVLIILTFVL